MFGLHYRKGLTCKKFSVEWRVAGLGRAGWCISFALVGKANQDQCHHFSGLKWQCHDPSHHKRQCQLHGSVKNLSEVWGGGEDTIHSFKTCYTAEIWWASFPFLSFHWCYQPKRQEEKWSLPSFSSPPLPQVYNISWSRWHILVSKLAQYKPGFI